MSEEKKERKQFVVFVPEDHDIIMKSVPEKEFFKKKRAVSETGLGFTPDAFGNDPEMDAINLQNKLEQQYIEYIDALGIKLPENVLLQLGKEYLIARGKNPSHYKLSCQDGYIAITDRKKVRTFVGLSMILKIIQNKKVPQIPRDQISKVFKTKKIDRSLNLVSGN